MLLSGIRGCDLIVCLADRGVRISRATIDKFCNAERVPNIYMAYAIADYIGVPVTEIWPAYEWGGWNKGWEKKK